MGRRKPKHVSNISVTGIADKGMAVGRNEEGLVHFLEGGVPGDVVNAIIRRKKKVVHR